ncbi:hypothetical protein [Candidatus Electronema sp. PJ]|uniref:hypothetical protein n=1 Tax=Candidatus Electronema sp. PJ TaxID=3401572 RepID=UPI003AA89D79
MELNNENRQVLLTLLGYGQENLRVMRERVLGITTTSITLYMLFVGWIIQKDSTPKLVEIISLSVVILVFWIGSILVLRDISRGFISAHKIIIRIEKCLDLYKPGVFLTDESLFPEKYSIPTRAEHFKKFEYILSFSAGISIFMLLTDYFFSKT